MPLGICFCGQEGLEGTHEPASQMETTRGPLVSFRELRAREGVRPYHQNVNRTALKDGGLKSN